MLLGFSDTVAAVQHRALLKRVLLQCIPLLATPGSGGHGQVDGALRSQVKAADYRRQVCVCVFVCWSIVLHVSPQLKCVSVVNVDVPAQ